MVSKKAQIEAITLVLIGGIVIGLVGLAYTWGKPIMDKRSVVTQYMSARNFMETLDKKITSMVSSCISAGSCEETLNLPVPGIISVDEANNLIIYRFVVNQPLISKGEVLFNTGDNSSVTRYGETPSVISLKGEKSAQGEYLLVFTLRYRELDSEKPWKGYLIKLVKSGKSDGNSKIIFSYDGSETIPEGANHRGDLIVSKIKVQPI